VTERRPVVVVGGGAVGSFLGAILALGGHEPWLLDRPGMPVGPDEIRVHAPDGRRLVAPVTRTDDPAACPDPEFVVVAVRMTDLAAALPAIERWPRCAVVTVENGLGAEEMALAALPGHDLVAASLVAPVAREPDGAFGWRRRRGLALAPVRGSGMPAIAGLRAAGAAVGLPVSSSADWRSLKWSKLLTNLVANATCAILDMEPAEVYADRRLFEIERAQMLEALAAMRAHAIRVQRLPGADVRLLALGYRAPASVGWRVLRRVAGGARGGKLPSLALHVRSNRGPTEAPWLNGGVVRAAADAHLAAPVNSTLERLVEAVASDPAIRARLAGNPTALIAQVQHAVITGRAP
jgi:2-dehydropantoate 2-reductase